MTGLLFRFLTSQSGATAIEYGLISSFFSVVCASILIISGRIEPQILIGEWQG